MKVPGDEVLPPGVVTATDTELLPAGETAVIWVAVLTVKLVASVPPNVTEDAPVKFDPAAIHAASARSEGRVELKRGARVRHETFGDGTILTMEGSGPDAKLTVYFDRAGSKKFIAKYAKLTRI